MKHYTAIMGTKRQRGYLYLHIYKSTRGGFINIGMTRYQPQATRGEESEIMTALSNCGEIPKKYSDPNLYFSAQEKLKKKISIRFIDICYLDRAVKYRKLS